MQLSVFYHHLQEAAEQTGSPLADILDQAAGFGISAVELDWADIRQDAAGLRSLLAQHGFTASSVYGFFEFGQKRQEEEAAQFLADAVAVGASKVLVIPGFLSPEQTEEEQEAQVAAMIEAVQRLCDAAEPLGITVTMEDFDDRQAPFARSEDLLKFLSAVPQLGCTFDTGNFIYSGEDELRALDKLAPHVVHVHCKDRSLEPNSGEGKLTLTDKMLYPSPVGGGCIAIRESLRRLREAGYTGTLAIEHFGAPDQLAYMRQSADWLRKAWK
ncbi:sugar phosphate isomerase/epimerase [Gorillibacterium sp. CAU 1737]|uniref:sugar phosphate isomerase/epimerase family protein n=1 Tax=Gorillibacterium sp. CAU 1737 TaxID=3140362 RepID=UPI0032600F34